jgi:hypothetical protein
VLDSECHSDFLACLDQVMLSGGKGFSRKVRGYDENLQLLAALSTI